MYEYFYFGHDVVLIIFAKCLQVAILVTDNHGKGFHDQEMDMRRMEREMEELINNVILSVLHLEFGNLDVLNLVLSPLTGGAVDLNIPHEFDTRYTKT